MAEIVGQPAEPEAEPRVRVTAGIIKDASFKRRRWYHRRDIRFVALIAAFIIVFQSFGYITGPSRITPKLHSAIDGGAKTVDILIWAKFPAEAFHMERFQVIGLFRGDVGDAIWLTGVKPDDIRSLARKYWIDKIDLASPAKKL
jgi:hypothetical protein